MIERYDHTPAALYARVSSDRQDVDLSVAAQLRALRDYARKNGYMVAREFIDEAESGRIADRPQFRKMIDEASRTTAPFKEILVSVYAFPESAVQVSPSSLTFNEFNWNTPQYVSIETIVDHDALNAWAVVVHDIDGPAGAYINRVFVRVVVDDQDEQSDDGS